MRKISVCIVTYNHEPFIRVCLDSVLKQRIDCEYEVVLGEDCSTDNTLAICQEYADLYPGIVKLLKTPVNLGMSKNALRTVNACTGDYIAVCEGDDYWTDPDKLQRQLDFLEANPDYSMIAENGLVLNTVLNTETLFNSISECDLAVTDLLRKRQFPSASVLLRAKFLRDDYTAPTYAGDTFLWCYLATRGKVKYSPVVSSVYRRGMQGVVLSTNKMEWAKLMERWNEEISEMLPQDFNRDIFKHRNYSEYLKAFFFSTSVKDRKNAVMSIKKCFHYQPVRTAITLSKFFVKKLKVA